MAVPVIYCFESVPLAAMQTFVVPAVPTANAYYAQQCVMHPAGDQQFLYNMQTRFHSACATNKGAGRIGQQDDCVEGLHQDSTIQRRRKKKNREAFASASSCFDELEDKNVSVVLSNLPKMLWSETGFEVALDATLVKDAVRLFAVERTGKNAEAVVILKTEAAAQTLMKHFTNINCGRSGGVVARYCEERGKKLLSSMTPRDQKHEAKIEERAPLAKTLPSSKTTSAEGKTSITVPLVLTQTSLKMRWADYEDDCDSDYGGDAQSTIADALQSSSDGTDSCNLDEL